MFRMQHQLTAASNNLKLLKVTLRAEMKKLVKPWHLFLPVRDHVLEQVKRAERQFLSLPQRHQNLLPAVLSNLDNISQCADHNQEVLQAIIHNSLHMFENIEYGEKVSFDSNPYRMHSVPRFTTAKIIGGKISPSAVYLKQLCTDDFVWCFG